MPTIVTGAASIALLMLGFNMIVPLSSTMATICDLAGIICVILFIGLTENAGASVSPVGEDD